VEPASSGVQPGERSARRATLRLGGVGGVQSPDLGSADHEKIREIGSGRRGVAGSVQRLQDGRSRHRRYPSRDVEPRRGDGLSDGARAGDRSPVLRADRGAAQRGAGGEAQRPEAQGGRVGAGAEPLVGPGRGEPVIGGASCGDAGDGPRARGPRRPGDPQAARGDVAAPDEGEAGCGGGEPDEGGEVARRGDLVLAEGNVGVCFGGYALFVGIENDEPGLIRIPFAEWQAAWAIG